MAASLPTMRENEAPFQLASLYPLSITELCDHQRMRSASTSAPAWWSPAGSVYRRQWELTERKRLRNISFCSSRSQGSIGTLFLKPNSRSSLFVKRDLQWALKIVPFFFFFQTRVVSMLNTIRPRASYSLFSENVLASS